MCLILVLHKFSLCLVLAHECGMTVCISSLYMLFIDIAGVIHNGGIKQATHGNDADAT